MNTRLPRPRLRTILLVVNILVLGVPLLGIAGLQIYDTQLVRRTEAEVISQAAHLKAFAEDELRAAVRDEALDGLPDGFGIEGTIEWPEEFYDFHPVEPRLDSSRDEIREPERAPEPSRSTPDPIMARVGERMDPVLAQAQRTTLSGMHIVDWNGTVVATTNASQREMSLRHREEVERALNGEVVHLLRRRERIPEQTSLESLSRETSNRVFFALPLVQDDRIVGAVTVWRTPMSLPQALYKNRGIFGILLGLMLLGGLSITGLTAFYIGRPIRRLIEQTEKVIGEQKEGSEPIGKPGTYEVQQLSESIAEMATTLEERADYIRTFARSVSHEFKTPLTSIRGTVELLQDHLDEMSEEERAEFLEILDADAERLEHLVRRLLELAKADVARQGDEYCDAKRVTSEVANAHATDDFNIAVEAPEDRVNVMISEDALRSALTNLVVNAREHGDSRATLTVEIVDGERVTITIEDDGPGISEANAGRIFDEFFTTARERGGTGLGLSITRALLAAHEASIRYIPSEGGAIFEIDLGAHPASAFSVGDSTRTSNS